MNVKYILAIGVAIAATLCGCKKEDNRPVEKGVPMTLTASIASTDTKAIATPGASGIDFTWEENAQISILTLNDSGKLLTNDIFTSTNASGATTATFAGSFTGDAENTIVCYYPALTSSDAKGLKSANGVLIEFNESSIYGTYKLPSEYSENYLGDSVILTGDATITGSELNTTLNHRTSIIKVTADISLTQFASIEKVIITSSVSMLHSADWFYLEDISGNIAGNTAQNERIFDYTTPLYVNKAIPFVTYIPSSFKNSSTPIGTTWNITLKGKDASNETKTHFTTKTFASEVTFQPGVCYTINISAAELK